LTAAHVEIDTCIEYCGSRGDLITGAYNTIYIIRAAYASKLLFSFSVPITIKKKKGGKKKKKKKKINEVLHMRKIHELKKL